eukprot:scaffold9308_cov115-Cylindrotheca_fusiformis.AAC.10
MPENKYSYDVLKKKIAKCESMMKAKDSSSDEYKELERKKKQYKKKLELTPEWKEEIDEESFGLYGDFPLNNLSKHQKKAKDMIESLIKLGDQRPGTSSDLKEEDIINLCKQIREVFLAEKMVLTLSAPIKICADLHGQFYDLLRLFEYGNHPIQSNYLFLGDYVDRGKQSVETMCLLFAYKLLDPSSIHLLRGNHETSKINRIYGFYDECKRRYSVKVYKAFCNAFNCMPMVAVVEETIVCMHGGLSPGLEDLEDVNKKERPCEIPEEGLLCDLVWADPDPDVTGWVESDRGVSYLFGKDILNKFLEKNDYELVVRGHQVVEDGYQFFNDRKLVTLFSAPNYCGEFDNSGAMMIIDKDMSCSFQLLKPVSRRRESILRDFGIKRLSASDRLKGSIRKIISMRRVFGGMDVKDMLKKEKNADRKSYARPSTDDFGITGFSAVFFAEQLTLTLEIEDLTRKNTTWGDVWDDLYYDDEQLAEFKYEAFMESLEEEEGY